jgi:hypothetical protein
VQVDETFALDITSEENLVSVDVYVVDDRLSPSFLGTVSYVFEKLQGLPQKEELQWCDPKP